MQLTINHPHFLYPFSQEKKMAKICYILLDNLLPIDCESMQSHSIPQLPYELANHYCFQKQNLI